MAGHFFLLDTFTNEKFKGNPTPVCTLDKFLSPQNMHSLAREFNAPVTAFVGPKDDKGMYPIRYFTVTGEIPACGHATLGAAFVLQDEMDFAMAFTTIEDIRLTVKREEDILFIEYPKFNKSVADIPATLRKALGIGETKTQFFCEELQSLFIELETEAEVTKLSPDFNQLISSTDKIKEVVVMSKSENPAYDFVLRSFCPWIGINEDPVTGSVHSVLGHHWQEQTMKNELKAFQASERGGQVFIRPLKETVEIGGRVRMLVEGRLMT